MRILHPNRKLKMKYRINEEFSKNPIDNEK